MRSPQLVRTAVAAAATVAVVAAGAYVLRPAERAPIEVELSLAAALAPGSAGFATAVDPRAFVFPTDHGPHVEFATEWWYFTGNVFSADGRRFGYELTFFRKALAAEPVARASAWAANQAYMAHLALTDVAADTMHAFDRFARGAVGLAGARATPMRVWLYDWEVAHAEADGEFRLSAAAGDVALDFVLEQGRRPVLQGKDGLSRKGPEPGNASYYYSLTRMPTRGSVTIAGRTYDVRGASWMDREWSTSALSPGLAGWDWFALQFDDATELMLYRLRGEDGAASPFSAGTFVRPDGTAAALAADAFTIEVTDWWRSPADGTRYPSAWRVAVPLLDLAVDIVPVVANQEMNLSVRYWEGAVDAHGARAGRSVAGTGYVELTGYAADGARLGGVR